MKYKHSKIKNSGIVFELLLRKLTSDTINGIELSPSLSIIKEFFNKKTTLGKEHELYQILLRNRFSTENKATVLLEQVLNSRKTINEKELRKEKFEIIKKIKEHYDIDKFFDTKLDNYKLHASIYKLFENQLDVSPEQVANEKYVIIEHIISNNTTKKDAETILEKFEGENKDVRLITYKLLVDKFNKKYSSQLDESQKKLLKEYIYNASNNPKLLEYVKYQVPSIIKELEICMPNVTDKVTQIKLHETISMLGKFSTLKFVKDDHILSLMRYYELLKEIKETKHD